MSKRKNLRVLATGGITHGGGLEVRTVDGGLLVQDLDLACEDAKTFSVPTKRQPTSDELDDLLFALDVMRRAIRACLHAGLAAIAMTLSALPIAP